MSNSTSIRENIAAIRAQIDAAARETGRTGADITLVGASKHLLRFFRYEEESSDPRSPDRNGCILRLMLQK